MIPEKNKKYGIACLGPCDYNRFGGVGIFTGEIDGSGDDGDPLIYQFKVAGLSEIVGFYEGDIICEAV